jgi:hypothetical protein
MIKKLILILLFCSLVLGAWGTLEDFTTYTESDEGNDITVAQNTITMTVCYPRLDTFYVYDDKGVNHFSGDFTHRVKVNMSVVDLDIFVTVWGLSNTIGDEKDWRDAGDDGVRVMFSRSSGGYRIYIAIIENGGTADEDYYGSFSLSTDYYLTLDRDDDGGANSTGRYTVYICTTNYHGEAGSVAVDTLTADCSAGEQNDFRYVYPLAGYDDGGVNRDASGTVKDLDLGEAGAAGGGGQVIIIEED